MRLSVYIHVPFCRVRCDYCDFYSIAGAGQALAEATVNSILARLESRLEDLAVAQVGSVFFGGGTPSHLAPALLSRLVRGVVGICTATEAEVTMETNPEDVDQAFLQAIEGVNRLSLGVQSFDQAARREIGRAAADTPPEDALDFLADRWPGRLNVDLISALPSHRGPGGPERAALDVRRACEFPVDHLSVYTLTIDEDHKPAARLAGLRLEPDEEARLDEAVAAEAAAAGFASYEISAYARPGCECAHNLSYWHLEPYLGVGPGAVSTLPGGDGRIIRTREAEIGGVAQTEHLSPGDFLKEYLMMNLRLREGLDLERFEAVFGHNIGEVAPGSIAAWRAEGLVEVENGRLVPDNRFFRLLNTHLVTLFEELDGFLAATKLEAPSWGRVDTPKGAW